ncbi:MAG TPA: sigma-70 family RNA polymerase sigma factor [Kofleriaceae bacterium]|nr:sigma-70 family RNA polymerase sigma factor [Kofleriaceae bacterium]
MPSELTDQEIAAIYEQFGAVLLRRCRRLLGDGPAAEDALHEAFVKIWRYGASYREASSRLSWLYRAVDRVCFDALAARARRGEQPITGEVESLEPPRDRVEDWQLVRLFLHRLDERLQRVAVLHWVDEMTQDEIARATGWSRQTVCKKLEQLRDRAARLAARLRAQESWV